jgi:PAS domain S-box-containing protein
MSQQRSLKRSLLMNNHVANSSTESNSTPHKRRRQTNQALEALGQLIKDPSVDDLDSKLNKNDVLSLTLARLLRRKYWSSNLPNQNVQLAAGIESSSIEDDLNGFIIVLNTNGRIILMNDNIEYYLRKNVRSLYPQLTSIYDCVSSDDHESIRRILSTPTNLEQQVICTWNLPRGKRPSRTHTESKSMLMTGHFFFINNEENKEQQEPLFVARCEQVLSSTPNIPTNTTGLASTTTLRFVLTDQLNISEISSNTESLLGYKADELIDQSINRFIAGEHIHLLEQARQNCIVGQHYTTMNVLDLYTRNGDRLSFLCNTHMLVEGRRKALKLGFLAQLIDPSIQCECASYAHKQNLERIKNSVQQESTIISGINLNSPITTNILSTKTEACFNLNDVSSVCPVTVIPQRRKRRRTEYSNIKTEPFYYINTVQQAPQSINDSIESQISSSDSLTSSASPIQELGYMDGLFPYIDDIFEFDNGKIKFIDDFPSIDDVNDVFGISNAPQYCLITPTTSSFGFFA